MLLGRLAQAILTFCLVVSSYKLKKNESLLNIPHCVGLPLQGPVTGADEWSCDSLSGTLGTTDEFKCTHRYDGGVDGKVYQQCEVHKEREKHFNCLASRRCIPNGDVKFDGNLCHCDPKTGSASVGKNCTKNFAYECSSCLKAFYLADDKHCKKKLCSCDFGIGSQGADCPSHGSAHCASCDEAAGYIMDQDGKTCILKKCLCEEGGTAAVGLECPVHNSQKCKSCLAGYTFRKDGVSCKLKQYTCLLDGKVVGQAAKGIHCDNDGANKCLTCDEKAGYTMDGSNNCILKQCLCTPGTGTAAVGPDCPVYQAQKCASCNVAGGFKFAADPRICECDAGRGFEAAGMNACVYKQCTCNNGQKAVGTQCPRHGMALCTACDAGYRLEAKQCAKNVCTCDYGTAATGAACDVHEKHQCAVCQDANYELIDGKCIYKICQCPLGTRAEGDACPKHGATMCVACDQGSRFAPGKAGCLQNVCNCQNGSPVMKADCTTHNEHKCAKCKDGNYQLISGKCEFKVCKCNFGTRVEGASCPAMDAVKCKSCNTGYHLNNASACVANVCTCEDGEAATGAACDVHKEHKCVKCDAGHQLIDEKCTYKVCTCSNGVKAEGEDCRCHNCKTCKSCNAGFHPKNVGEDKVCWQNFCSCADGVKATGVDCTVHDSNTCTSCNDGYDLTNSSCRFRVCPCPNGVAKTGLACPLHGQENCVSCTDVGYELVSISGRSICKNPVVDLQAVLATKQNLERTAVAWGDPHIKVFDYHYKDKTDNFTNYHAGWVGSNLNTMEPGTYWLVKTPDNMVSIQGVYGWGWRSVIRSVAISGRFILHDKIQVFPKMKTKGEYGLYYKYNGIRRQRLHKFRGSAWNWENSRKDVNIKWVQNKQGLNGRHQYRCKITLPLFVEVILNIYNHHLDVVLTMRPIDGMWGDMGNINNNTDDEMKWNPASLYDRNPYWYQMTTAHGTKVAKSQNLFPYWYDVPNPPAGAKTTALLEVNKTSHEGSVASATEERMEEFVDEDEGEGDESEKDDDDVKVMVVDGVMLEKREGSQDGGPLNNSLECTPEETKAARKLCHDFFKVNNSVEECAVDVCQEGPEMALMAEAVEEEAEENEEEEEVQHYKIYEGGRLYHSCFVAEEHFSKIAAMPRDARELRLIQALATEMTLLGARCRGELWVYLDGTRVPESVISSKCENGQHLCVQGANITACDGAEKIACQIPRMYTCKGEVTFKDIDTACPAGMQVAVPISVREIGEANKAMEGYTCTTVQAWSGYNRGPKEKPECFQEGENVTRACDVNGDPKKTVMCETKFA